MSHLPFHVTTSNTTEEEDTTTILEASDTKITSINIHSHLESNNYVDTTGAGVGRHHQHLHHAIVPRRCNGNEPDVTGHYIHHPPTTAMTATQGEEGATMLMFEEEKTDEQVSRSLNNMRDDEINNERDPRILSLSDMLYHGTTTSYTNPSTMAPTSLPVEEATFFSEEEKNTVKCLTTTTGIDITSQFYDHDTDANDDSVEIPAPITPYNNDTHDHSRSSAHTMPSSHNLDKNSFVAPFTMNLPIPLLHPNLSLDDGEGRWKDSISDEVTVYAGNMSNNKQDINPSNFFSFHTHSNDVAVDTGGCGDPVSAIGSPKGRQVRLLVFVN